MNTFYVEAPVERSEHLDCQHDRRLERTCSGQSDFRKVDEKPWNSTPGIRISRLDFLKFPFASLRGQISE